MRRAGVVLAALLALASCQEARATGILPRSGSSSFVPPSLPSGVVTLMYVGDSQVAGIGGDSSGAIGAPALSAMFGIGGDTTGGAREHLWKLLVSSGAVTDTVTPFFTGTQTATTKNLPANQNKHEGHSGFCASTGFGLCDSAHSIADNFATWWGAAPASFIVYKIAANDLNNGGTGAQAVANVGSSITTIWGVAHVPILYETPFFGSAISAKRAAFLAALPAQIATLRAAGVRVNYVDCGRSGPEDGTALHQTMLGYYAEGGCVFRALTTLSF